jgi:lipopolysaccharide/colanic/teichoic acid biosynthesis glycosyltransferase
MDAIFLTNDRRQDERTNLRSVFRRYSTPAVRTFEYSGFFYVGDKPSQIQKLVSIFERGYAADGIGKLHMELLDCLKHQKNILPEVIVCETGFDPKEIGSFVRFLRGHPQLKTIPFIIDGSDLNENGLAIYRKVARPDEILPICEADGGVLLAKIRFLRRMKEPRPGSIVPMIEKYHAEGNSLVLGFGSKRIFDIIAASFVLLVLSPLFLLIALAIKLESKGPVFYISKRAGRGYKVFNFYKFRTMVNEADRLVRELSHLNQYNANEAGPVFFKVSNDPRVTRVGTFLRNTSLDELPQLLNVIFGDMSLVGNRPLPLYEASTLTTDDYAARFMAPAGITGLWQIKKRGNKDMSVEERINMDIDYATKCSFVTDLWIIANTPSALFQKENV